MVSDPIRTRLLELSEGHGISLSRLSQMLGKNPSYLQQFVRRGSPRKLEENDRARLAQFFGVDEGELGRALPADSSIADRFDRLPWAAIPRLAISASAGPGAETGQERAFDTIRFSAQWLRAMGLQPGNLSTITVTGDSMEPTLRHGDEILVDGARRLPDSGVYVVRIADSLLVKRLDLSADGMVTLLSDNPDYPPAVHRALDVEIIGRVVWKGGAV